MNIKGQNTVEYILMITAVLLVCLYFFSLKSGPMFTGVNATLNSIVNQITTANSQIQFSQ